MQQTDDHTFLQEIFAPFQRVRNFDLVDRCRPGGFAKRLALRLLIYGVDGHQQPASGLPSRTILITVSCRSGGVFGRSFKNVRQLDPVSILACCPVESTVADSTLLLMAAKVISPCLGQ